MSRNCLTWQRSNEILCPFVAVFQHIAYKIIKYSFKIHITYSMRCFQLLTRPDFLIACEYHLNGVWVLPINETGGRASGPLGQALHRAGRKHSSDFARVISRCRELKSIPDTEKLMNSRYQKMISQGIIPDILISANAVPCVNIYSSNSFISERFFPPSGERLGHRKLAHDKQPTAGCIEIFHKYCCYTKCGHITTNLTLWNHWGYVTDVSKYHNAGKWSID